MPCMPSVKFNTKELTTNTGAPVISNEFSLRAGNRGEQEPFEVPISVVRNVLLQLSDLWLHLY